MVLVFGYLCSEIFGSILIDKYGRKKMFMYSQTMAVIIGIVISFSYNFYFFTIFRFIQGLVLTVRKYFYVKYEFVIIYNK